MLEKPPIPISKVTQQVPRDAQKIILKLLNKNPKPTVDEARLAMSGNLCRCGAYEHYLRGVMKAAGRA